MLELEKKEDALAHEAFVSEGDRRTKESESGTAKLFSFKEMEDNARNAFKQSKK